MKQKSNNSGINIISSCLAALLFEKKREKFLPGEQENIVLKYKQRHHIYRLNGFGYNITDIGIDCRSGFQTCTLNSIDEHKYILLC
jgi:hypothetical protein